MSTDGKEKSLTTEKNVLQQVTHENTRHPNPSHRPQVVKSLEKTLSLEVEKRGGSFMFCFRTPLFTESSADIPDGDYSAIELAEVMDKGKPCSLMIPGGWSDADCERAVAELQAQGLNVAAVWKDGELKFLDEAK